MGRTGSSRSQYIFALVASACLMLAGLMVAFNSVDEMRTIGLLLLGIGAVGIAGNVYMRARTK